MAEAVLLAAGIVLVVGTVALLLWRVRDPTWVRDAQLTQNASPVTSLFMLVLGTLLVALASVLGIVLIATGRGIVGWTMACLAVAGLAHVSVSVWIRRRPLP
ncbi:hypothetical protein I8920_00270 [Curtobacterium sp. YC1]|uniref:hypothetical protein n=1 Tax=Curtobacterium sp. YC1 TaxID=2795488 RepID=UPI0018E55795|nr:hypothetical protein [Curtobacterium sp. YC1]QQD76254.1 hypothetical protein I8920_00270 [Curtobacterium sp. YC1]